MKLIIAIFSAFMIFGGVYDSYLSYNNPEPIKMSVSEYSQSDKSKAVYVTITDAKINLLKSVVLSNKLGGSISRLYVPIESNGFQQDNKTTLILNSSDTDVLNTANEVFSLSETEQLKYLIENRDKLMLAGEISGRLVHSKMMESDRREEVSKLMKNLDGDFYVLNHNASASKVRGPVLLVLGLLMMILVVRRKRTSKL